MRKRVTANCVFGRYVDGFCFGSGLVCDLACDSWIILSRRSTTSRSAVFLPIPGICVSRAKLLDLIDSIRIVCLPV